MYPTVYNTSKSRDVLGLSDRSLEETVIDTTWDFERRGWMP